MVRGRRTRRAAAAAGMNSSSTTTTTVPLTGGSLSPTKVLHQNGVGVKVVTKGNVVLVEDFCCASPKRKEYKIDELLLKSETSPTGGYTLGGGMAVVEGASPTKTRMALRGTHNSQTSNGTVVVTNGGGVTTNGRLCPVAGNEITRFLLSQSKSKSRKARKKSPNFELVNDDTCDSFTHATTLQEQAAATGTMNGGVVKMEADEENDEAASEDGVHPFQMFGRMPIGNGMVAEENIFLQEPVLKLTVDEAACVLVQPKMENGHADDVVVVEEVRKTRAGSKGKTSTSSSVAAALINQDSNSGDSGVVIDKLQEGGGATQGVTPKPLLNVSRPRVPTTPHRILCPSSPQLNGGAVKEEEGMTVEGEGAQEDDPQSTNRKLILPTKDEGEEDEDEDAATAAESQPSAKVSQDKQESAAVTKTEGGAMKAPKTNGVSKAPVSNHQSTMEDFFKVRRSVRKTKKEVEREEQLAIEKAILSACDVGLAVKMFENKGRGIVATRPFARGEFVVEYVGQFISIAEANRREKLYAQDQNTGCYMYYFKHKNKQYCIDATEETGKLGRLVNHSRFGNLMTRTVEVKGQPHLVLIAKEDIEEGRELNYDYGDRSKESLLHHPWLAY